MKLLLLFLLLSVSVQGLAQTVQPAPNDIPAQVQKAQKEVWDLQFQLYQAQHDLVIAQIEQKETELKNLRDSNPAAYANQYLQMQGKLEEQRSKAEMRLNFAQQWYQAVQAGDMAAAASAQQQMNQ